MGHAHRFLTVHGRKVDLDEVDCKMEFKDSSDARTCQQEKDRYISETEWVEMLF
jgi:hypothetical protein